MAWWCSCFGAMDDLERLLRSIPPERVHSLQAHVARYAGFFVWDSNATAFEADNVGGVREKSAYGLIVHELDRQKLRIVSRA